MINCQEAGRLINGYVNNTLSMDELEGFLKHVHSCPECMDDLEMYYIVDRALQQLDGEDNGSTLDMRHLLEMDMRRKEQRIKRRKAGHFFWLLFLGFISVLVLLFLFCVMIEVRKIM